MSGIFAVRYNQSPENPINLLSVSSPKSPAQNPGVTCRILRRWPHPHPSPGPTRLSLQTVNKLPIHL
ncbi:hypothetical protein K491DRAFT_697007 [Lophiostoma macrostomum CBS 122681]|uniref:Uncharacterized protein n=1 Tax=Lophiostoma macrostomum CBS 122681 TaxID=1314788 RepID=A0A6A6STB5_9PLEO|nr:hypothetical protein K491DRAFT_697007 [Lophiostoma macrostomum CBS 122681]